VIFRYCIANVSPSFDEAMEDFFRNAMGDLAACLDGVTCLFFIENLTLLFSASSTGDVGVRSRFSSRLLSTKGVYVEETDIELWNGVPGCGELSSETSETGVKSEGSGLDTEGGQMGSRFWALLRMLLGFDATTGTGDGVAGSWSSSWRERRVKERSER